MKGKVCLFLASFLISLWIGNWKESNAQIPCQQPQPITQITVTQADLSQAESDIRDYEKTIAQLNKWQRLANMKYERIELKYLNHVHDLKLELAIQKLEKELK